MWATYFSGPNLLPETPAFESQGSSLERFDLHKSYKVSSLFGADRLAPLPPFLAAI